MAAAAAAAAAAASAPDKVVTGECLQAHTHRRGDVAKRGRETVFSTTVWSFHSVFWFLRVSNRRKYRQGAKSKY